MDVMNGRMLACQILIAGLIARVASDARDPERFFDAFRDEVRAVVGGINIAGLDDTGQVRDAARRAVDELFALMKFAEPPAADGGDRPGRQGKFRGQDDAAI